MPSALSATICTRYIPRRSPRGRTTTRNVRFACLAGAGVYYLRLRVTDDERRVDARRIVVERKKNGTWVKRGKFVLEPRLCR